MKRYDGDGNNAPCLKNGHKAHWALLTGTTHYANDLHFAGLIIYNVNQNMEFCIGLTILL